MNASRLFPGPRKSQYKNCQSKFLQHDNVPQFSQCQTILCSAKNTLLVHRASLHERLWRGKHQSCLHWLTTPKKLSAGRELCSFVNGLAVARLTPLCASLVYEQTGTEILLQAHFHLEVCTQQMAAFNSAFEVCFDREYKKKKKLCSSCWRTRATWVSGEQSKLLAPLWVGH